jgi:hypothetical protein
MIRKQMLQCMTDLLLKHSHAQVPKLPEIWLQSVLTNIHDPEIKVQELVLEVRLLLLSPCYIPVIINQIKMHTPC